MSLNDLFTFLSNAIKGIPFSLFDYVLILALVGYAIEEGSYNIGISLKRSILFVFCTGFSLLFYRFPSVFIQANTYIPKGISDVLALCGLWFLFCGLFLIISRIFAKTFLDTTAVPGKLRIPSGFVVSLFGFFGLVILIVHTFVSLPLSPSLKSFINSSYFVNKILNYTLPLDYQAQRLLLGDQSSALHVVIGDNGEKSQDLRFLGRSERNIEAPKSIVLDSINQEKRRLGREEMVEEKLLTEAAGLLGEKYVREGAIGHENSDLINVLEEKGIVTTDANIATVMVDSTDLISSVLFANQELGKIVRDPNSLRLGISIHEAGGNGFLAVIIFTN